MNKYSTQELAIKHGYYYITDEECARFCNEHGAYGFFNPNSDFCSYCGTIPNSFTLDKNGVPVPPGGIKHFMKQEEIKSLRQELNRRIQKDGQKKEGSGK